MHFQNPQLLYALFLLIIPILIHLFQLRRFQKEAFTNVAFLKRVNIKTRKSSQLKKWLVLLTRLLALAALILAFARPFLSSSETPTAAENLVIYLDNSQSMQAKGPKGPLFQRAVQDLLATLPNDKNYTLLTNNSVFPDISNANAANKLLELAYSSNQLSMAELSLKAGREFKKKPNARGKLILVSDFQKRDFTEYQPLDNTDTQWVQMLPVNRSNVSLDSAYVDYNNSNGYRLHVLLGTAAEDAAAVPVSFTDGEELAAKGTAQFGESQNTAEVIFDLNEDGATNGKLAISDSQLTFDNTLYFNINAPRKIRVLVINAADDGYLKKIFRPREFELESFNEKNLNYSLIPDQDLIILNELPTVSPALRSALDNFANSGGTIAIIPATAGNLESYNALLRTISNIQLAPPTESMRKVTSISYDHPLYRNVFERRVTNFQYPSLNLSYGSTGGNGALSFADNTPFLASSGNTYVFTAPLNTTVGNFQSSPLIVPTFYNMARLGLDLPKLYYNIGAENSFDVPIAMEQDEILSLEREGEKFIPLQEVFANKVSISTTELPEKAGIYAVAKKDSILQNVSYNYDRSESDLQYPDLETLVEEDVSDSLEKVLKEFNASIAVNSIWKWFVIFALLALVMEMLLLKFLK